MKIESGRKYEVPHVKLSHDALNQDITNMYPPIIIKSLEESVRKSIAETDAKIEKYVFDNLGTTCYDELGDIKPEVRAWLLTQNKFIQEEILHV